MSEKSFEHPSLPELQQQWRERLKTLLKNRDELGMRWAEHASHNRANTEIIAFQLGVFEHAISNDWPDVADLNLSRV